MRIRIRTRVFTLMRIRIRIPKMIPIRIHNTARNYPVLGTDTGRALFLYLAFWFYSFNLY